MIESLDSLGEPDKTVLIGIVDGIPDLNCVIFQSAALSIEQTMVPADHWTPDIHGTEIFSVIFGEGPDALGIAQGCSGISLPIFFSRDAGPPFPAASQMDLARALNIAAERGVSIVNVSAGQRTATPEAGRHLEDALSLCNQRRMLVVAATGNDCCACLHVPAAVPTVLAVGAMDANGQPLDASNWGASYASNGLLAPGVELDVIGPGDKPARRTGTSFATAIVSAVAARLLSLARQSNYALDALDVRTILIDSADPCETEGADECAKHLSGSLNTKAAVKLLHERGTFSMKETPQYSDQKFNGGETKMSEISKSSDAATTSPASHSVQTSAAETEAAVEQQKISGERGGENGDGAPTAVTPSSIGAISPPAEFTQSAVSLTQQACGCGGAQPAQMIYALGALWFDFGNEARYDAIVQQMNDPVQANTPTALFEFLGANLQFASGVTFILMQDQVPLYAVQPSGSFALEIYRAMLDATNSSLDTSGDMQRVAIPGFVSGTTTLMNGMILPVVYPDLRGMVKWQSQNLVENAIAAAGADDIDEAPIMNFLVRVYDELRNFGMSPEDRAINFAATNAYQITSAFSDAIGRDLELFSIRASKSPICRPDSDCWDVQLQMFDPENERRAGRTYRFTVDVSEVLPVTVGPLRNWASPLSAM
jgi:cyanobactin maturation PatA/PatG family protease